jgi:hypothetical protein
MILRRGSVAGRGWVAAAVAVAAAALTLAGPSLPAGQETPAPGPPGFVFVARLAIPANIPWTDTGLDVSEGEEFHIRASGNVSLQKGNPMAFGGPEGLNIKTVQQPLQDRNLGALVARVAQLISITKDEETGEETRNEIVKLVFIGPEATIRMPLAGRLSLGPNENVVADNAGEFRAEIWRKAG